MSRLSRRKLDHDIEEEMFRLFWTSLSKLRGAEEVSSFFTDLLTETEEVMLAKRFSVAILLLRGKRPKEISQTLHITFTTIGSVAAWLKNAKPHTRKVLERIIGEQDWQAMLDRVDRILYNLPPTLYTQHWSTAHREKVQHEKEISNRKALR